MNGATTDLGVLAGGTNSYALGLNNSNQVVGSSSSLMGNHAVSWQNGVANESQSSNQPIQLGIEGSVWCQ